MRDTSSVFPAVEVVHQEPFKRIVPLLKAALLLGVGGGFGLAAVLTLTRAFSLSTGIWWFALAQAQGDLQLYGWAGLFMIGIAFHFLPRLCGTPLPLPRLIPWVVVSLSAALLIRALSQPLVTITDGSLWRILLLLSGILECVALVTIVVMFILLLWRGLLQAPKPALRGMLPFLLCAFISLALVALVNLTNMVQAGMETGIVQVEGDSLDVVLGLFGFLVPVALALSIRLLPMYAGLGKFPPQAIWPLATTYLVGLALICTGVSWMSSFPWLSNVEGLGMVLLSVVLLAFVAIFLYMMRLAGRLPRQEGAQLAAFSQNVAHEYQAQAIRERGIYGPFVRLIASAYIWGVVGALLLISRGTALLLGTSPFVSWDVLLYSFTNGFIALLLGGISARMLPGFSGRSIAGPAWVTALFWLGNAAALLYVGSLLLLPVFVSLETAGLTLYALLFGISGPMGLAFAVCLLVNLWPTLRSTVTE